MDYSELIHAKEMDAVVRRLAKTFSDEFREDAQSSEAIRGLRLCPDCLSTIASHHAMVIAGTATRQKDNPKLTDPILMLTAAIMQGIEIGIVLGRQYP